VPVAQTGQSVTALLSTMSAPRFTGTPLTTSRLMQPVNTTATATLYASAR